MAFADPTGGHAKPGRAQEKQLAARHFETLDGARLGLVGNSKLNADELLLAIGDLIAERYALETIVHDKKESFSLPVPDAVVERIANAADVVIAGVGD